MVATVVSMYYVLLLCTYYTTQKHVQNLHVYFVFYTRHILHLFYTHILSSTFIRSLKPDVGVENFNELPFTCEQVCV